MIRCANCGGAISGGWEIMVNGHPFHKNCVPVITTLLPNTQAPLKGEPGIRSATEESTLKHTDKREEP